MKNVLPIEVVATNFFAFMRGGIDALQGARDVIEECRAYDVYAAVAVESAMGEKLAVSPTAITNLVHAVEHTSHKIIIETIDDFLNSIKKELNAISADPVDLKAVYDLAPDCAWNSKNRHGFLGSVYALETLKEDLDSLATTIGEDEAYESGKLDFDDEVTFRPAGNEKAYSPVIHASGQIDVKALDIQMFFVRMQDTVAEMACRHAIELVKALGRSWDTNQTLHEYLCWRKLFGHDSRVGIYMGMKSAVYAQVLNKQGLVVNAETPGENPAEPMATRASRTRTKPRPSAQTQG